jgi:carboxyl-terminal processing protease
MTTFNFRMLGIVFVVCFFCYGNAVRFRKLGDLGLVMDLIDQQYVSESQQTELYQAAMRGMIDSLDPYSGYISQDSLKPFQSMLEQEFGGLGISLDGPPRRERLTIISTLYDSPAFRAGLKPGDVILQVDGVDVAKKAFQETSQLLRGKVGTIAKLSIQRGNDELPFSVDVTREMIEVESVLGDRRLSDGRWEHRMQADPSIGYFRVELFGEKTSSELEESINKIKDECRGIILDLRDNSGGLLESATTICDMFLSEGEIVSTKGRSDLVDQVYSAHDGVILPDDVPIVVLINENSASASEVLAACLQDRCRAVIAGSRSFGKGSVQNVIPLEGGKAAMRLTTAYYYPPNGRRIHRLKDAKMEDEWGVKPNEGHEITMDDDAVQKLLDRYRKRADPSFVTQKMDQQGGSPTENDSTLVDDPQLLHAVRVILGASKK